MRKSVRFILLTLLALLGLLQFVRPEKNLSGDTGKDISQVLPVPADIQGMLQTACYDCHSNRTTYPWYAEVQPVGLWLNHHIEEGKGELNFSEFAAYNLRRQYHKLEEVEEQVNEGKMPLSSYTLIHRDALLSPEQKAALAGWATVMLDTMKAHYPLDSLVRKR